MTDERIRALARRAQQGDVDARASLLRERLRAGTLDPARLEVAARMGDAGARRAFDAPPPIDVAGAVELLRASDAARVAVTCAWRVLPIWQAAAPDDREVARAVEAFGAWLAGGPRPDPQLASQLAAMAWTRARTPTPGRDLSALRAIVWAANLARDDVTAHAASCVREALDAVGLLEAPLLTHALCLLALPNEEV